ncbi:hypothetical protein LCGC14_1362980 [marine sediment metagenome]|uniref:Uncharacterized protein n=1 Tax=marine sediment metagenome TaxID=412755 RepID=A0A0F9K7K3_9ZZZZ
MPEPSAMRCSKCGDPLWLHRVYLTDLMFDRDSNPITVSDIEEDEEWDYEEVVCHGCNHKPTYRWEETGLGHIVIVTE